MPGDAEDDEFRPADIDAGIDRGRRVDADGIDRAAERGARHQQEEQRDDQDGDPGQHRDAEEGRALQADEGRAHLVGIDPGAAGDDEGGAAIDGQRAERHHDRRNVELPDQQAVDRAEHQPDDQRDDDQQRDRDRRMRGVQHRHHHAGEAEVGRHRQVDRAGQDHHHLAERQDHQDRGVVEHLAQIGRGRRRPESASRSARSARRSPPAARSRGI